MAYRRTRSKIVTNPRHFLQARKRHRNARRSREIYFEYENDHKRYERFAEHGDNSGNNINTVRHDNFKGKSGGI